MINPDEGEPYILNPEEEERVLTNERRRIAEHYAWHMKDQGQSDMAILQMLSEIDWSKDPNYKPQEVLRRANANKHHELWQLERRQQEKEDQQKKAEELRAQWTARTIYRLMQCTAEVEYGKTLIVNSDTLPLIKVLCYFLSEDERFESELHHSLKKGLLIRGVSGIGKTFLVNCVRKNELNPVHLLSMIEITDEIKAEGEYQLEPKGKVIYLDDVGTEETPINYYGTKIVWFKDFLELYYAKARPFNRLMISTNNSFAEIEAKYGFRVRSRVKDMFNVIDVNGKDLRGL